MNKKLLFGTLALMLGGMAGAQSACQEPPRPQTPTFSNANWIRTDGGTVTTINPDFRFEGNSLLYYADQASGLREKTATTATTVNLGDIRFLRFGFTWANFGNGLGRASRAAFAYGDPANPTVYLEFLTPGLTAADTETAVIRAVNGATLYNADGQPVSSLPVNSKAKILDALTAAIVFGTEAQDNAIRQDFFIKLPDNAPSTGVMRILAGPQIQESGDGGFGDDMRFFIPEAAPVWLCLRKQIDEGALSTIDFNAVGLDTKQLINGSKISIPVSALDTPFVPSTTPYTVTDPGNVTVNEQLGAVGYTITQAICNKPPLPNGDAPQMNIVAGPSSITFSGFAFSAMTTCTLTNVDNSQIQYPRYTLAKQFTGFENALDSANLSIAEAAGGGNATGSVSNSPSNRTGQIQLQGKALVYEKTSDTTTEIAAAGRPAAVTFSETLQAQRPGDYTSNYSCANAAGGSTVLPAPGEGTSLTIAQPQFGDNITCTFVNELTVAAPTTNISLTKTGQTVVTAGTAVIYTITAENKTATAVDVDLTDQLNPTLPADQVTSVSNNGTYDAATGLVTWPRTTIPANGTISRTVTVDLPDPAKDSTKGDSYNGLNQVTNTANLTTYTEGTSTPLTNTGTSSASVTTNHLFAQVRKTVRNMTRGGAAGTVAEAANGDTLQYCLNYVNQSAVPMTLKLTDTVANTQKLVAGSFTGGTNTGTGNAVVVTIPNVDAGGTGSVCFNVTVNK